LIDFFFLLVRYIFAFCKYYFVSVYVN